MPWTYRVLNSNLPTRRATITSFSLPSNVSKNGEETCERLLISWGYGYGFQTQYHVPCSPQNTAHTVRSTKVHPQPLSTLCRQGDIYIVTSTLRMCTTSTYTRGGGVIRQHPYSKCSVHTALHGRIEMGVCKSKHINIYVRSTVGIVCHMAACLEVTGFIIGYFLQLRTTGKLG